MLSHPCTIESANTVMAARLSKRIFTCPCFFNIHASLASREKRFNPHGGQTTSEPEHKL
jgi:hypothetical protein